MIVYGARNFVNLVTWLKINKSEWLLPVNWQQPFYVKMAAVSGLAAAILC